MFLQFDRFYDCNFFWAFNDLLDPFIDITRNFSCPLHDIINIDNFFDNVYSFINCYLNVFYNLNFLFHNWNFNSDLNRLDFHSFLDNWNFSMNGFHNRLVNMLNIFGWDDDLFFSFDDFKIIDFFRDYAYDFYRSRNFQYLLNYFIFLEMNDLFFIFNNNSLFWCLYHLYFGFWIFFDVLNLLNVYNFFDFICYVHIFRNFNLNNLFNLNFNNFFHFNLNFFLNDDLFGNNFFNDLWDRN